MNFDISEATKFLQQNLSEDAAITDTEEDRICYSYDGALFRGLPDIIVFPACTDDIKTCLNTAVRFSIPVTARGRGTGETGGAIPVNGGIALSFEKMNKIISIDPEKRIAVVQPGVITDTVKSAVKEFGLFYPPDPSSSGFSTIGGNVAENAGGLRGIKYGVTKNYIAGLEYFDAKGNVHRTGIMNPRPEQYPGLAYLLTGSEGTLCIISRIALRLIKAPEKAVTFLISFPDRENAAALIEDILKNSIRPSVMEYVDSATCSAITHYSNLKLPKGTNSFILLEIDGSVKECSAIKSDIITITGRYPVTGLEEAAAESDRVSLWKMRKAISPALRHIAPDKINEDIVVPRSRLVSILTFIEETGRRYGILIPVYGHTGDGNLHVNLMVDFQDAEMYDKAGKATREIFTEVIRLGGSLTGEHGVGLMKIPYMDIQFGQKELEYLKSVKKHYDPDEIFNPRKLFPDNSDKKDGPGGE